MKSKKTNFRLFVSNFLDRLPYVGKLRRELAGMRDRDGRYPAGHYYSPVPDKRDVLRHISQQSSRQFEAVPGVDMHEEEQLSRLQNYVKFYKDLPFPEQKHPDSRYYFNQSWFCYADAIFLYCHLRQTEPRRIVEVGSGFSSAVMLDTAEQSRTDKPEMVFIDPNPERLYGILKPEDRDHVSVIEDEVQNAPLPIFSSLQAGDLLFIDSSHVVKTGNDLYFLFFEVFPKLAPGVTVHFHDIFYPFDYPSEWLSMGRYWNEAFFLRAFLSDNAAWQIKFFNSYAGWKYQDFLEKQMPLCLKNTGGSIYLEKEK
jgi:hypothetical protein